MRYTNGALLSYSLVAITGTKDYSWRIVIFQETPLKEI
jgi:hypothetical protein